MLKLAKLICEKESLMILKGKISKEELIECFLKPNLQNIYSHLADDIIMAKLSKEHIYRIQIQVHAQEKEKQSD